MDAPPIASTLAEIDASFLVRPCPACAQGPWQVTRPESLAHPGTPVEVEATCRHCGHREQFTFRVANPMDPDLPWQVNPTDEPSRLIDLAGWMGLFYGFLERASRAGDKAESRRLGYKAAVCLAEALKFYGPDDELPGPEAFFTDSGAEAYRRHTEKFARQKLRDMQARLPALDTMESRLARDAEARRPGPKRKWWQFWKR
jgi:hypothetical protein